MSRALCAGLLLAALAAVAPTGAQIVAAPSPSLTIELEPTTVTIGDRVEARITLDASGIRDTLTAPPRFPVWEQHWGNAEILRADSPSDQGDGIWIQRLELALFETGSAILPGIEVQVPVEETTTTARSNPATLQVDSVLPTTDEEVSAQPPAPVRALPAGRPFWWAMTILGLAFLALAYFALRSAQRIRAALAAMELSPIEAFQGALARLRGETGVERVYTGLSLELRRYLGRALGFPAAEGTTTQIQRSLRERQLPPELVRDTLGLLREADQIKFARGESDRQSVSRRLDDAQRLASDVETWLEPVAEETEAVA